MLKHSNRRQFIQKAGLAGAGIWLQSFLPSIASAATGKDIVRLGLIGCGSRGAGIAGLLGKVPSVQLVAVCDVRLELTEGMRKYGGAALQLFSDYRKLLERKDLDAVVIATPLYLHAQMATDALMAGKHVYVEKTMTYSIAEALALEKMVAQSNLVFQVGHQYRYYDLYHQVKNIIDKGWLGTVTQFDCQYNRNSNWRKPLVGQQKDQDINWRMYRAYSGGLLAELCAHQIDVVNWFTGTHPLRVAGIGGVDYWKDGRETFDHVETVYQYPKGITANVRSTLMNEYKGYSMRILGTKATIEILRNKAFIYAEQANKTIGEVDGVSGATLEAWTHGEGKEIKFGTPETAQLDPTCLAIADFANCIVQRKKPFCGITAGKQTAISVHLGNEAAYEGRVALWENEFG